ncbi:MAG: DUF5702 domain-containing protein [Clostridia bacterium]|nr:DUF5702 domain-containing protein [Clostridia bacterium]
MSWNKSRKGGIAVFQCIILTGLLLFAGIMIDIARIMLAEKEVQSAVNAAARSVLANYDENLAGDYGLFALNTVSKADTANEEFFRYLSANLQVSAKGFNLIRYKLDKGKTSACGYRSIISNSDNAFKEQILEYVKYRVPLMVTENIIDKISASGIFSKKDFAVKAKNAREKSTNVKANIERLNDSIKELNGTISYVMNNSVNSSNVKEYTDRLNALKKYCTEAVGGAGVLDESIFAYRKAADEACKYAESANNDEALQGEAAIKTCDKEFGDADGAISKTLKEASVLLAEVSTYQMLAEPLLKNISTLSLEISILNERNGFLNASKEKGKKGRGETEEIYKAIEQNNDRIRMLESEMETYLQDINKLKGSLPLRELNEIKVREASDVPEERPERDHENASGKLSALSDKFSKLLGYKSIKDEWLITGSEFEQAKQKEIIDPKTFDNRQILTDEKHLKEAETAGEDAFALIDRIRTAVEAGVEKLYIVEYIMDKFTYHSSLTERDHYFRKGEVEYILWGGKSQNANIAQTIRAVGIMRYAINSVDYFATSKVPHPVLRLVYAAGRGLVQSFIDCYELYGGKSISICPTLKKSELKVDYAEHLRIFLLLQSAVSENTQLNNIRQLIQVNSKCPDYESRLRNPGFMLSDYNTALRAKVSVEINLWFLPLLKPEMLGFSGFKGSKYVISKEIHVDY